LIRLAVFGRPIAHSLSPRIHRAFAEACGLAVDYRAIEASAEDFAARVSALAASGGRGCNVTLPFKHDAWTLAARSSDGAARARAANTLVFETVQDWYADNTDGPGLVDDLERLRPGLLRAARVCLLGAGGAAAGVLAALLCSGTACVVVANRTLPRAAALVQRHTDLGRLEVCTPERVSDHGPYDLIVNATSSGHQGGTAPVDAAWLRPDGLCYDLNYGPAAEPLRCRCASAGVAFADGLGMLVAQAALSFELWTGQRPAVTPVLEALRREAAGGRD
jgi:shikimate dehydrogenase